MLRHILTTVLILTSGLACAQSKVQSQPAQPESVIPASKEQIAKEARMQLLRQGIRSDFLGELELKYHRKNSWFDDALKLIEPNVYGFLYQGDYMKHNSKKARKKTFSYLLAHHNSFMAARNRYGVSPESIAALLWVETKLGSDTGKHPIPFVFYSISLASQPSICRIMANLLESKLSISTLSEKPDLPTASKKLEEKCRIKSEWAASELKTLSVLHEEGRLNAFSLKGSFAGAFGIPQFLPSSYEKYAVSNYRKKPNLFLISDAILSVGNFLKKNGWKSDSPDSQKNALFAYNHSKDYSVVIQQIAERLTEM
ncbi:MAG: lytic murein transglycosylase [Bdellovibrionales bacterium]|nr:lytic murein transglycosylase [Bdellovibrionales bacterium]